MRFYFPGAGSAKHLVDIDDGSVLSDLMGHVELMTGVPTTGQKLVLNGKALTSLDHGKTLRECKVTNNCKIMVLGKRFDPQADQLYKQVGSSSSAPTPQQQQQPTKQSKEGDIYSKVLYCLAEIY